MALVVGCSFAALAAALTPASGQQPPGVAIPRSPSTVGLTAADFDTAEYEADHGLAQIGAATAYARGFTGLGVTVAVVDTGIDPTHPEFAGRISPTSQSFFSGVDGLIPGTYITDTHGHGTHVSGTIGAARDGAGMMGVAYESTNLTLATLPSPYMRALYPTIGDDTPAAIDYAAAQHARILNGSYGPVYSRPFNNDGTPNPHYVEAKIQTYQAGAALAEYNAIKRAADGGMLLVFAASNDRGDQPTISVNPFGAALYPYIKPSNAGSGVYQFTDSRNQPIDQSAIDFSGVAGSIVAVVAVDSNNKIASFSNWCGVTAAWCIAAPGVGILSTVPQGTGTSDIGSDYGVKSGTSMAAPHVSGAAAVLAQAFPFMTAPQIAQTMFTTATPIGPADIYGWGLLNLGKAIDGPAQFTATWTVDTQGYFGRFANDIGGVGGLVKTGAGTLELAGTDTYAGPTTVNAGALALAAKASLTSRVSVAAAGSLFNFGKTSGGVTNAGSVFTSGTIAGGVTNTGAFVASAGRVDGGINNAAGTFTLSGSVASDGAFANAAGATLSVTGAGAYGLAGALTNAGTVSVAQGGMLAAAGISNTGLLQSAGVLNASVSNAGSGQLSGQLFGTLINTGTLQFIGSLAGVSALTNDGALDLGATALTVPSLSGSTRSGVIANGSLTVNGSVSTTYAGDIVNGSGIATLTKAGTGTLILTGDGRFTGATSVEAGTLSLNGYWTSPVTVGAAGTLRGIGTVAAPLSVAGGLRPGNSPGTLTVAGPVTFAPGSAFGVDIDGTGNGTGAGNYSRLLALGPTGKVAANGTLVPVLRGISGSATNTFTPTLGQRFDVLVAQGGLSDSFAGLSQPAGGLGASTRFDALYGANGLNFVVTPASYGHLAALGLSQSGNAQAVGSALDRARPAAGVRPSAAQASLYDALYAAAPASLGSGLASLSGQTYGDALMGDLAGRRLVGDAIDRHMSFGGGSGAAFSATAAGPNRTAIDVRAQPGVAGRPFSFEDGSVWADALGDVGNRSGDRFATGADFAAGGLLAGLERRFGLDTLVGGAFSYVHQSGTSAAGSDLGRFTNDSYGGTLYGTTRLGDVVLRGTAGGAYGTSAIGRTLSLGTISARAGGSPAGGDLGATGLAGYRVWSAGPLDVVPEMGFSYDRLTRQNDLSSGGFAQQVFSTGDLDAARTLAGVRLVTSQPLQALNLRFDARAYWAHEVGDTAALVRSSLFGAAFTTRSSALPRDSAVVGLSLGGSIARGTTISVSYTGEAGPGASAHLFSAGLRAEW